MEEKRRLEEGSEQGTKKRRRGLKQKKAFFYRDTLEKSDDSGDSGDESVSHGNLGGLNEDGEDPLSESSEPMVKVYPANCDTLVTRTPTPSELARFFNSSTDDSDSMCESEEPGDQSTSALAPMEGEEKSKPDMLWGPEENEVDALLLEADPDDSIILEEMSKKFEEN